MADVIIETCEWRNELKIVAQHILDKRGYLIVGRREYQKRVPVGAVLPSAEYGHLPGPMTVIGFTDYAEYRRQHDDYAPPALDGLPMLGPEKFIQFVKVVAE